jgi:hypothetical protein
MRHIFLQPLSVTLLTHFVVQSARFRPLILFPCRTLFFHAGNRGTRRTVPVATIATAADNYESKATLTVKNPAVL